MSFVFFLALGLYLAALPVRRAIAQEFSDGTTLQASLSEEGSWTSNPLMVVRGARSLWGSTTSPRLMVKKKTPLSAYGLDLRVDQNVFNQSSYNSTDIYVRGDFVRKNERWEVDLPKTVTYDTTRTSELVGYNVQPIISRHLGFSVSPQISFRPSSRETFSLSGAATLSEYEKEDYFTDYETFTTVPSYKRKLDENNSAEFSVRFRRYQTARDNAVRVDSWGPSIGWQTVLSPRLSANASVGAQKRREYNFGVPVDQWTWSSIFSGKLSYTGIQDNLNISASRGQSPYGNASEVLETSFSVSEGHKLNDSVSFNVSARYLTSDYQKDTIGDLETLTSGHIGLSYRIIENIDITAGYNYRYETLTNLPETAQDSTVSLGLVFHPNMWTLEP